MSVGRYVLIAYASSASGIRVTYFGKAEVVLYWNNKVKKIEERFKLRTSKSSI